MSNPTEVTRAEATKIGITKMQREVLQCDAPELIVVGGLGSGKSMSIAHVVATQSSKYVNNYGMIAMTTGPQLVRSIIHDVHEWYGKYGISYTYNEAKRMVTFPYGSKYFYQTLDIPWRELKGPNLGFVCVDEMDTCEKQKWDMLCGRARRPSTDQIVRGFSNPTPEGHWLTELYNEFKASPNAGTQFITLTSYDNPCLSDRYIERLEKIYPPGTPGHRRWLLGEMGVPVEGAVYPEFSLAEHGINQSEEPPYMDLGSGVQAYINGIDFGYNNPFCFLRAGLTDDDVLVINGEYYQNRETMPNHAKQIRELYRGGIIIADHDSQSRAELAMQGLATIPAIKEVNSGIDMVRERFREGRLKIVVEACPNLIRELGTYRWAEGTSRSDARELPFKKDDHACDALRYIVAALDTPRDNSLARLASCFDE